MGCQCVAHIQGARLGFEWAAICMDYHPVGQSIRYQLQFMKHWELFAVEHHPLTRIGLEQCVSGINIRDVHTPCSSHQAVY